MLSILVAAYNARKTLPQCLDSLCAQTFKDIEILCVDDCSTDDTLAYLQQRAAADNRIKVLQTSVNSGQAVARNLALKSAQGEFVTMVDADDWLSEDAVEKVIDVFQTHQATDCVVLRLMDVWDEKVKDYGLPATLEKGEALSGIDAFEQCLDGWKLHGLYVARRRLYERFPFDTSTRLYSDDNTSRLHYLHSREVRACEGIYYYRHHAESMTTSFNIHRFDFMEANLSLLFALKKETLRPSTLKRFEGQRWMTFIACLRLYLRHKNELQSSQHSELQQRFETVLHTFRPSRLPLKYRWKPGYLLTLSYPLFLLQQKIYCTIHK